MDRTNRDYGDQDDYGRERYARDSGDSGRGYSQGQGHTPAREAEYRQRGDWQGDYRAGDDRGRMGGTGDWRGQGGSRETGQQPRHEGWRSERWGDEYRERSMPAPSGMPGEYGGQGNFGAMQPIFASSEVWLIEGPHTGRGPRGYRRSDERIQEEACERLTRHGQVDASDIDLEVRDGEVTLRGQVDDRRAKRLAEEAIESVPGVRDVQNQIRVRQPQGQGTWRRSEDTIVASRPGSQGQVAATADDPDWQRHRAGFQQHFTGRQTAASASGARRTWEEAEPNYRFGYDASRAERYRGRRFDEAEADLRRDYEARGRAGGRGEERKWEELREEVREGFERLRN